jgi:hypothetical protein
MHASQRPLFAAKRNISLCETRDHPPFGKLSLAPGPGKETPVVLTLFDFHYVRIA